MYYLLPSATPVAEIKTIIQNHGAAPVHGLGAVVKVEEEEETAILEALSHVPQKLPDLTTPQEGFTAVLDTVNNSWEQVRTNFLREFQPPRFLAVDTPNTLYTHCAITRYGKHVTETQHVLAATQFAQEVRILNFSCSQI